MKPLQDLETMEEYLLEHSICYYYSQHKFLYRDQSIELHADWIDSRTIYNYNFDKLEQEYVKLASLLDKDPKVFNQMSVSPQEESVWDKIIEMSMAPAKLLAWPYGYKNLEAKIDSSGLKDRIDRLLVQKTEKQLI